MLFQDDHQYNDVKMGFVGKMYRPRFPPLILFGSHQFQSIDWIVEEIV